MRSVVRVDHSFDLAHPGVLPNILINRNRLYPTSYCLVDRHKDQECGVG